MEITPQEAMAKIQEWKPSCNYPFVEYVASGAVMIWDGDHHHSAADIETALEMARMSIESFRAKAAGVEPQAVEPTQPAPEREIVEAAV